MHAGQVTDDKAVLIASDYCAMIKVTMISVKAYNNATVRIAFMTCMQTKCTLNLLSGSLVV